MMILVKIVCGLPNVQFSHSIYADHLVRCSPAPPFDVQNDGAAGPGGLSSAARHTAISSPSLLQHDLCQARFSGRDTPFPALLRIGTRENGVRPRKPAETQYYYSTP